MPLSTSNSERQSPPRNYTRAIAAALTAILLLLVGCELIFRFAFSRISRIESRTHNEHLDALAVRQGAPGQPTILLLGNSLLLEGVDYPKIKTEWRSFAVPTRFVIEQTGYIEWSYGIRRLLSEGARPNRIILCLNIPQLVGNSIRGEYSSFYLFRTEDLFQVGKDTGADLTHISSLFFARYSLFFAGRNSLRNFALNRLHPAYGNLLHDFTTRTPRELSEQEVRQIAGPRLAALRTLCAQYGIQFDFMLAPGFGKGEQGLIEAGKDSQTSVLIPLSLNQWGYDRYRDGFHLNEAGAATFTKLFTETLWRP